MTGKAWQLRRINNWLLHFRARSPFWFDVLAFSIALVVFAVMFFLFAE